MKSDFILVIEQNKTQLYFTLKVVLYLLQESLRERLRQIVSADFIFIM